MNIPRISGASALSAAIITLFAVVTVLLLVVHIAALSPSAQHLVDSLQVMATMVVGYWVGSSSGSRSKDAVLAASTAALATVVPIAK